MLLFLGQVRTNESSDTSPPLLDDIGQCKWQNFQSGMISITACDFSNHKDRLTDNDRFTTGVSGNPVIESLTIAKPNQPEAIGHHLSNGDCHLIKSANGVFCGFHLDKTSHTVHLFTDYLGLRQIYFFRDRERAVFSNARWLIEKALPRNTPFDEQSIIEIGVLGYPLGNKTRWKGVSLLEPGHLARLDNDGHLTKTMLVDLTSIQPSQLNENETLEALLETWNRAVSVRLSAESSPYSFLSGGMDSRLLVHTLQSYGATPKTANFAPPNTMDRVFAEQAAREMGASLWLHPTGSLNSDFITETVRQWIQMPTSNATQKPTIWSGDGGSVGLGHVYLDDEMVHLVEHGDYTGFARRFCEINNRKPVTRAYQNKELALQFESWIADITIQYGHTNPGRSPYYFLMLNDQRRHLDRHYESFHKREFDLELPFFDRRLIELVASLPPKAVNLHRLYDKLFRRIGGTLTATPWQTYPGHLPCEMPMPSYLEYQWGGNFYSKTEKRRKQKIKARICLDFCRSQQDHQQIFNKPFIAMASLLTIAGATDHSYLYDCVAPIIE